MEIAGGLYKEICCIPAWRQTFGSGGRAAASVSTLSPGSNLHTYVGPSSTEAVTPLKGLGIEVHAHYSKTSVAFVYFHPLSQPLIEPPIKDIAKQPPIFVSGKSVLRFGFLEGEAVVRADRAVYDPQSHLPEDFFANGSHAEELAVVLNRGELLALSGCRNVPDGVKRVMQHPSVQVVVVKCGTSGAEVYERGNAPLRIPAYRSATVFKIGTGDVFSAVFAHNWTERRLPAHDAADIASRSVSGYAASKILPVPKNLNEDLVAVGSATPNQIILVGSVAGIGRRYVMEEARFRLLELGAKVICESLDDTVSHPSTGVAGSVLVVAEGLDLLTVKKTLKSYATGLPVLILAENGIEQSVLGIAAQNTLVTNDFSSALYLAVWSAIPN